MLSAALMTVSLLAAYLLVVGLMSAATFGLLATKPDLAVTRYRLRNSYKTLQDALWLIFSACGGYVIAFVCASAAPQVTAIALAVALVSLIWTGKAEASQRGLIHSAVASICVVAGVSLGYMLRVKLQH
jgi:hypothetical protein